MLPPSFSVLSLLLVLPPTRIVSLFVLCDDIVLLEDVIGRRLFKALLPRISVLFVNIAGLPAVNIESPVVGCHRHHHHQEIERRKREGEREREN